MEKLLYRPVGLKELVLIAEVDFKAFPPRLPEQPFFYPVLNLEYAVQIARDWNAPSAPDYAGFVTRFAVDQKYVEKFDVHTVGNKLHRELWVPATELAEFNLHIVGRIEVVDCYYGSQFRGEIDPLTKLPKNYSSTADKL